MIDRSRVSTARRSSRADFGNSSMRRGRTTSWRAKWTHPEFLSQQPIPAARTNDAPQSDAEEHEPHNAEDQDRKPGGSRQQREHRRTRLGLARLGRGFDNPAISFCCHRGLIP